MRHLDAPIPDWPPQVFRAIYDSLHRGAEDAESFSTNKLSRISPRSDNVRGSIVNLAALRRLEDYCTKTGIPIQAVLPRNDVAEHFQPPVVEIMGVHVWFRRVHRNSNHLVHRAPESILERYKLYTPLFPEQVELAQILYVVTICYLPYSYEVDSISLGTLDSTGKSIRTLIDDIISFGTIEDQESNENTLGLQLRTPNKATANLKGETTNPER